MIFLHLEHKYPISNDIDKIIWVENPDENVDPLLFKIVKSLMIHGPCRFQYRISPCMNNGTAQNTFLISFWIKQLSIKIIIQYIKEAMTK